MYLTQLKEFLSSGKAVNGASAVEFLVSEEVFTTLSKYVSQVLVTQGLLPVKPYEMRQFFATKLLQNRFNVLSDKAWEAFMKPLATKHGFTMLDRECHEHILTSICGYDVTKRTGDSGDNSWKQRKNLLRAI